MYRTILVPTDGSDPAARAVREAVALAETTDGTVHALSVIDDDAVVGTAPDDYVGGLDEVYDAIEGHSERAVERAADTCRDADLAVRTAVRTGTPDVEITEYADEIAADLIVMGTHGRRGLSRLLLGSTTERVVRTATRPVLTVRAGSDGDRDTADAGTADGTGEVTDEAGDPDPEPEPEPRALTAHDRDEGPD
ncbi:hypothetical protein BRD17_08615 [Halobacteriales archaeon SW_7_68_16]|nr:MAG: hypothetical protein BRD17_08615 [Halobacteriales archaeon SW_7_68_16]